MKRLRDIRHSSQKGFTLVLSILFVAIFSAMAMAMVTFSGGNVLIAENQRKANLARACAESGLEITRYWMNQVTVPGSTDPEDRFAVVTASLQQVLADANAMNFATVCTESTIAASDIALNSAQGESFSVLFTDIDDDTIQLDVTGHYAGLNRTIRSNYVFETTDNAIFDYGVASVGPVALGGNIDIAGMTDDSEADTYVVSENDLTAVSIQGNSQITGVVEIVNPDAQVFIKGNKSGIGGATGDDAKGEPYTTKGVTAVPFPTMDPSRFEHYVTTTLTSDMMTSGGATFENLRIPAGMEPHFTGHASLSGVIFIEAPNIVTFTGNVDITGIIVADGDPDDDSGDNQIIFKGNVDSYPVTDLPDEFQFEELRKETGTFLIAPGFCVAFGGSFGMLNGSIGANGIRFFGSAGGTINGSLINYADTPMDLQGNNDLYFNRPDADELPAGFVPDTTMRYDSDSYDELSL